MPRSYLVTAAALTLVAWSASAQTPAPTTLLPAQPLLGSILTAGVLEELPTGNNPFTIPEAVLPETISNLFSAGGLNAATAPPIGGFLNSWTQSQYRIGDVSITDPRAGGTPLLLPAVQFWDRITTLTGAMGVDDNAPALSMTLQPQRPAAAWLTRVEGMLSAPALVTAGTVAVPAVDRVRQWQDGSLLVSGPLTDRLGLAAGGSWRGLLHVTAPNTDATNDQIAAGFAHLVWAATPRDEIRLFGWAQRAITPALTDAAVHVQSTWERRRPASMAWRVFAGYTARSRMLPAASTVTVDSLTSDPVSDLIDGGGGSARRWTVGARAVHPSAHWLPTAGFDLEGAQISAAATGVERIFERVDGVPARAWAVQRSGGTDDRHLTTFAAYANEHLTFRGLTLDAGLRLDAVTAAADAAAGGIGWTSWLPRARLRWQMTDTGGLAVVAGYRRSAYQLPLNVLAIGDPAAPVADISAWRGNSVGPLIARVGPGTGGNAAFTQIDPQLRRPITDELVLAIESRPLRGVQVQFARITKHEESLLGFTDPGLPSSGYAAFQVADPDFLPFHRFGAPQVTVFDRPADGYGRDRYLLTNQAGDPARFWGVELSVRVSTERLTLLFGGNLTEAYGPAAAVGFRPTENDQDVLGSLLVDPNAATYARGQLFQDRSHVVKLAGIYRFPWGVRFGAIARYQDGQPLSRLIVVPNLTQGLTAVRAYASGGAAFTYTGTLDVRVQKAFKAGRSEVSAILDVYNLPDLGNEVSEYVVSGPMFRTPTALQPPRTALLGVRVTF